MVEMLWVQNFWISAICIPYILIIREKPEFPPSMVSLEKAKEANFCSNIADALKLKHYVLLILIFMLLQGGFLAFGININQLLSPPFTDVEISGLGALIILVGVITSMLTGFILNKYHKYVLMVRMSAFGTAILLGISVYAVHLENKLFLAVTLICAAVSLIPIIPVGIDFASELTFPYEETVVTGFLLMAAQAFGFLLSLAVLKVVVIHGVENPQPIYGFGMLSGCAVLAAIISLILREDLRRLSFSRTNSEMSMEAF
jgi:FLVCR family feline leukemia virus subgroup C receptor-related protein